MIDDTTLKQLQNVSIEERIVIIETILQSLKSDIKKAGFPQSEPMVNTQRPTFGFMSGTGKILGDVIAPVLAEETWEVLQ